MQFSIKKSLMENFIFCSVWVALCFKGMPNTVHYKKVFSYMFFLHVIPDHVIKWASHFMLPIFTLRKEWNSDNSNTKKFFSNEQPHFSLCKISPNNFNYDSLSALTVQFEFCFRELCFSLLGLIRTLIITVLKFQWSIWSKRVQFNHYFSRY